jgi:orotate phosphoribosyltransferase
LFGPAYKGIPLSVAAAIAINSRYGDDISYCFNRKEAKDHGEGGTMVGYKLRNGDNILIIEDVVTAGTSVRECLPILKALAQVNIAGLVVSVDRMEKGKGDKTAIQELYDEFGIRTFPIVTVREIIDTIYNVEIDGKVYIDDVTKKRMEEYFKMYCVN